MSEHTQGPWVVSSTSPESFVIHPQHHNMWIVAKTYTQADARLMAAAPRMSEALKRAAHLLAEIDQSTSPAILSLRAEIVACIREATPEYYGITQATGATA